MEDLPPPPEENRAFYLQVHLPSSEKARTVNSDLLHDLGYCLLLRPGTFSASKVQQFGGKVMRRGEW